MKKLYAIILFALIGTYANTQQITYSKVIDGAMENAVTTAVDSGYVIAGTINGQGLVIKIDSAANVVWSETIGNNTTFNDVISTNDSCYVLVGGALCIKINSFGNTIWSKKISDTLNIASVQQTMDSGYIVTGYTTASNVPYSKIFVAKLSSAGNLQWTSLFAAGNYENEAFFVKQTADSGFVVTGYYENYPPTDMNIFLIKLSYTGVLLWDKKYPLSSLYYYATDLEITNNGFLFYLIGSGNTRIMKTDFSGNVIWSKEYSTMGSDYYYHPSLKIHKTSDNCYVFVSSSCGGSRIAKIDSVGNIIWSHSLFLDAVDVIPSKDKGFFITGNGPLCGAKTTTSFSNQIGIIKSDSLGSASNCYMGNGFVTATVNTVVSSTVTFTSSLGGTITQITPVVSSISLMSYLGCVSISGGVAENNFETSISISPNPTSGAFQIQMDNGQLSINNYQLSIYNVYGEKVYEKLSIINSPLLINLSEAKNGIYFLHLKTEQGTAVKKLIINK